MLKNIARRTTEEIMSIDVKRTQTVLFGIWTLVADFISYDNNSKAMEYASPLKINSWNRRYLYRREERLPYN